jgi:hypothetical protein
LFRHPAWAGNILLANSGSFDAFIVKYDTAGTPQWARRIGGTGDDSVNGISVDSAGNVYVMGTYSSTPVTIFATDNTTSFTTLANSGSNDVFIMKYDTAGTPQWARRIGGTGGDVGNGISADSAGNVYVTGSYGSNPVTIFNTNNTTAFTTLANSGSFDAFIVKYDTAGTPQWARRIGGTGNDGVNGISADSAGNVYVMGAYSSNPATIFNTNNTTAFTTLANSGSFDAFIVKYDTAGTPQWARRIGGTGDDFGNGISADSAGNVYVMGTYSSTPVTIFNTNNTTAFTTLANSGSSDAFIVKYDTAGTPQWARRIGGTGSEVGNGISADSAGNVYVMGTYSSTPVTIFAV